MRGERDFTVRPASKTVKRFGAPPAPAQADVPFAKWTDRLPDQTCVCLGRTTRALAGPPDWTGRSAYRLGRDLAEARDRGPDGRHVGDPGAQEAGEGALAALVLALEIAGL